VSSLLAKILLEETEMSEQRELFETGKRSWCKKLCQSIPPDVRQEVVNVLAQMGKKFLQSARQMPAVIRKESGDES
jgi:TorA maturation chaperone TorD